MKKILIIVLILASCSMAFASGSSEKSNPEKGGAPQAPAAGANGGEQTPSENLGSSPASSVQAQPALAEPAALVAARKNKAAFDEAVAAKNWGDAIALWQDSSATAEEKAETPELAEISADMESKIGGFLGDLSFTVVGKPAATTKGNAFKSPFVVKISSKEGLADVEKLKVVAEYPAVAADGAKVLEKASLDCAADGTVSFESPVYKAAIDSNVTFTLDLPQAVYDSFDNAPSAKVPYRVMTDMRASGGSIAIVDFNKAGKVITSNSETSSAVLAALIRSGFTSIGNCDFTNEVVSGSDAAVQRAATLLFGNSVTYLIYGTVKYQKVETTDKGVFAELKAEVKVRNLKKNAELLTANVVCSATEKSEWAAVNSARKALAAEIADRVLYGM